jgi:Na+/melibiose symporter-like transporter
MHDAVFPDAGQQAFGTDHRPTEGIAVPVNIFGGAVNDDIGPKRFGCTDVVSPMVQAMLAFPIAAIPLGGMFVAVLGIIADLTDYDQLKSGQRREAIYYGIYGIVRKTGWALCSLILAGVFSGFGYSVENPLGVRVIWLVCAASCLIGLLVFVPYKLGDTKEETKKIMGL